MPDREKVIGEFERWIDWMDEDCPQIAIDALALLKEYKRQDGCPCTHCMKWECDEVCEEYKKWKDT